VTAPRRKRSRRMVTTPLVSAIVPAYNAERTIDETLGSIRGQTYSNLEIVVVDDGSTDGTAQIVDRHARADRRVRLIRQANQGASAARNRAIADAKGEFIAPIDADDLWRPTKIQKQMDLMVREWPRVGLVYTWQAVVDHSGRVVSAQDRPHPGEEGPVFARLFLGNFVGGASALMPKAVIIEVGGYDVSLPAAEDLKLYLQIAERYEFAVVRECLTAYRQPGGLSNDVLRMVRCRDSVHATFRKAYPQYGRQILKGSILARRSGLEKALLTGQFRTAVALAGELFTSGSGYALLSLALAPMVVIRRLFGRANVFLKRAFMRGAAADAVWFVSASASAASAHLDKRNRHAGA